ncbi:MAG: TIGR03545 family protein [Candidatus Marinimicrobia bacterium]|nr:TIGR03545 family protein [Candidatus Neomarinimicrobiota bacterium]
MSKWIRWSGLIAFLLLTALIATFYILFADSLIKNAIEKKGTEINGATVDVAEVDISLFPLGISLSGLQITDPDEPMTNIVDAAEVALHLDFYQLLNRKLIISDVIMERVQTGTPRVISGKIDKRPVKESSESSPSAGSQKTNEPASNPTKMGLPDVNKIVSQEQLQTIDQIDALSADIQAAEIRWKSDLENLPNSEELKKYKDIISDLKKVDYKDLKNAKKKLKELAKTTNQLKNDFTEIRKMSDDFSVTYDSFKSRQELLRRAPQEDLTRLKAKYGSPGLMTEEFSKQILGPSLSAKIDKAITGYRRIDKLLSSRNRTKGDDSKIDRSKGVDIRFEEVDPMPDLLIQMVSISAFTSIGTLAGQITDISDDQVIYQHPIRFTFNGDKLDQASELNVVGKIDRTQPDISSDSIHVKIEDYLIIGLTLSESSDMPISIETGKADIDISCVLEDGRLQSEIRIDFGSVQFSDQGLDNSNELNRTVHTVLKNTPSFQIRVTVTGTLDNPKTSVDSDLDELLKAATTKVLEDKSKSWEKDLESALAIQVGTPLSEIDDQINGVDAIKKDLEDRLKSAEKLKSYF